MNVEQISLIRPVPDSVYLSLSDKQLRFFTTIGLNFCLDLRSRSLCTLLSEYIEFNLSSDKVGGLD